VSDGRRMAARVALAPCVQAWAMRSSEMQSRRRPTSKWGGAISAGHKKGIKSPDLMIRQSTIETKFKFKFKFKSKLVLPWRSS